MILWRSKIKTEKGIRSWRWIFEIEPWIIGFTEQVKFGDKEWIFAKRYYAISITNYFVLGSDHGYYDGPHCSFNLGYLHFCWSNKWCTKCMPN